MRNPNADEVPDYVKAYWPRSPKPRRFGTSCRIREIMNVISKENRHKPSLSFATACVATLTRKNMVLARSISSIFYCKYENTPRTKLYLMRKAYRLAVRVTAVSEGVADELKVDGFGPEIVVHLAAIHFIPYCNKNPVKAVETNILGTRYLLEACKSSKLDTFVFASSAAIYGISDSKLSEEDLPEPNDIYGFTKLTGEDLCRLFHLETGVRTIIGRLSNVYGPGETNAHVIPEIIKQLIEGKAEIELGNIEPKRDFINVKDVAEAFIALLDDLKGDFGIFNIGSGKEYSVRQILEICERIIGSEIRAKGTKSRIRKTDRMHLLSDVEKIMRETSWRPRTNIEEGLRELLRG
ncbi:MAG: NAD-dependent epimerase/dehydratase family protein [Thermodesulfobacteriota bacterium]